MRYRSRKTSGRGRRYGLAEAFLVSGSRSVVASLWSADDTFTHALMDRFYTHIVEGEDQASALRDAKLDLLAKYGRKSHLTIGRFRLDRRRRVANPIGCPMSLELQAREKIYARVSELVKRKHFDPGMNGADWNALASARRDTVLQSGTDDEFETKMQELLNELKTSHTGFRHAKSPNVPGRHAISATFMRFNLDGEQRWMFQDVHEGGPAHAAGIRPGDILLQVRNRDLRPPDPPIFPVGEDSQYAVQKPDGKRVTGNLQVPSPRSKKHPVIVPKSVICSQLPEGIGWLKVTMFPGAVGIDLAKALDNAFAHLRESTRLIVDLRGNTGGGIGGLRLMSYLTPGKMEVGYSLTRKRKEQGYEREKLPRFGRIPSRKSTLIWLALRYGFIDKSILVVTEGLGSPTFSRTRDNFGQRTHG